MAITISGSTGITYPGGGVSPSPGLGEGQTYQNVTSSRTAASIYTNSTALPIFVVACLSSASPGQNMTATVGGSTIATAQVVNNSTNGCLSFVVPAGSTYSVTIGGTPTVQSWWELR